MLHAFTKLPAQLYSVLSPCWPHESRPAPACTCPSRS